MRANVEAFIEQFHNQLEKLFELALVLARFAPFFRIPGIAVAPVLQAREGREDRKSSISEGKIVSLILTGLAPSPVSSSTACFPTQRVETRFSLPLSCARYGGRQQRKTQS